MVHWARSEDTIKSDDGSSTLRRNKVWKIKYLNRSRGRPTQWVALDCFVKKNIWIWEVYYQLRAAAVFVFWGNLSFWSVALLKLNLTVFSRLNICADWLRLAHSWDIQRRPIDQKTRWNGMRFETILIWV